MSEPAKEVHEGECRAGGPYLPLAGAVEAERAVLGVFLHNPETFKEIRAKIGEGQHLADSRNRLIYLTACEIDDSGQQPVYASVVVRLREKGLLDEAGGVSYVDSLLGTQCHYPSLLDQHCLEMRKAYVRSRMYEQLGLCQQKLTHGEHPAEVRHVLASLLEDLPDDEAICGALEVRPISAILESSAVLEWCVDGIIPANSVGIISGESCSGKTWLVLTLALAVASGQKWLGLFDVKQTSVLIIDQEMGETFLRRRLNALGATRDLSIGIACFQNISLETPEGQAKLADAIKSHSAGLVLIDALIGVHDCDENSASEMKRLTRGVARIARDMSCVITFTHHVTKPSRDSKGHKDSLRGSSEIKAGIDWQLAVKIDQSKTIAVKHEKGRADREIPEFYVFLRSGFDEAVRLIGSRSRLTKPQRAEILIMDIVHGSEEPVVQATLLDACDRNGIKERSTHEALKALVDREALGQTMLTRTGENGGTSNQRAYICPGSGRSCSEGGPLEADFGRGGIHRAPRRRQAGEP